MKTIEIYTVREINTTDNLLLGEFEFDSEAEALEYALTMNDLMKETPLNYRAHKKEITLYA